MGGRPIESMAIVHVCGPEKARQFEEQVCAALSYSGPVIQSELSASLSVHSGAGLVGVGFVVGG